MLITEITSDLNEKQIWGRRGKKLVRKYRCMGGRRKGRIVANIGSPAMQAYMENYGITFNNLFELYYYRAGDYDYDLIKVYLYQFYNSYVTDYPIKTVIKEYIK